MTCHVLACETGAAVSVHRKPVAVSEIATPPDGIAARGTSCARALITQIHARFRVARTGEALHTPARWRRSEIPCLGAPLGPDCVVKLVGLVELTG